MDRISKSPAVSFAKMLCAISQGRASDKGSKIEFLRVCGELWHIVGAPVIIAD